MNAASDSALVASALVDRDQAAFGELVRRHQSAVRRFLRGLTRGDAAWADDLAQDTFVQAFRSLSHFEQKSRFLTWLFGIAHNQFRNARRKRRDDANPSVTEQATLIDDATSSASQRVELQQDLNAALSRLSDDERAAIHLHFQQGLSHGEIAAALEWPLGTVKTHLARAKEKLRPLLAAWNPQT